MAKNNKQLSNVQEVRSKNNLELTLQQEQRLYKLHEKKHIGAFDEYTSCENVVVFGKPLSGKSTVINSLLGHKLKSIAHPDWSHKFLIDLADLDHESQLKISRESNPEQKELTPVLTKNITIWECPGLYKTVGMTKGIEYIDKCEEEMKMRESPRVMQLLKTVNSVKFILVADYNDLTVSGGYRGEKFLVTVDRIASIFSDLDIIKKSMLLVINKAPLDEEKPNIPYIVKKINDIITHRRPSDHTKTLMKYLTESPIYIFYKPEKAGEEVEGPTLEYMAGLSFCDVSLSIQYPCLSPVNQELALKTLAEDEARIQEEEEAKKQLEQAEIDMKNISNAGFFIKIVDFLYDTLSSMSILSKAGQYAGEILMTFSSLFKGYFSSNKMQAVSEKDNSLPPMSSEKAKLAKCLVKMLNENENLREEFKEKFNKYIEKYINCKNDEEKQSIVKQFSEWIISETNLQNELLAFEAESHISDESYNSSEVSNSSNANNKNSSDENGPESNDTGGIENSSGTQSNSNNFDQEVSKKPNELKQSESSDTPATTLGGNKGLNYQNYQPDMVKIKSDFATTWKNFSVSNLNISEDNRVAGQALLDETVKDLYNAIPTYKVDVVGQDSDGSKIVNHFESYSIRGGLGTE